MLNLYRFVKLYEISVKIQEFVNLWLSIGLSYIKIGEDKEEGEDIL